MCIICSCVEHGEEHKKTGMEQAEVYAFVCGWFECSIGFGVTPCDAVNMASVAMNRLFPESPVEAVDGGPRNERPN